MALHKNTVSQSLLEVLDKIMSNPIFDGFVLVGGTALSMVRGHRMSIDIDIFTDMPYGSMPLQNIKRFFSENFESVSGIDNLDERCLGYTIRVKNRDDEIKMDMFYTDPFIFPIIKAGNMRFADPREIIAMKMLAICGKHLRHKDFWDIHEMLDDYSLDEMIRWGVKRYSFELDYDIVVKNLKRIRDLEYTAEVISTKGVYWDFVKMDLEGVIDQLPQEKS